MTSRSESTAPGVPEPHLVPGLQVPHRCGWPRRSSSGSGRCIERKNYWKHLQQGAKRSNGGIDDPKEEAVRGLTVSRSRHRARPSSGEEPVEETQPEEKQSTSSCWRTTQPCQWTTAPPPFVPLTQTDPRPSEQLVSEEHGRPTNDTSGSLLTCSQQPC